MRDDFRLLSLCARMRCPQHSLWILMAAQSKTGHFVTRPFIWDCVDSMRALATQFLIHGSRIKFLSYFYFICSGSIRIEIDESPIFFLVFSLSRINVLENTTLWPPCGWSGERKRLEKENAAAHIFLYWLSGKEKGKQEKCRPDNL
jgi:hypothetical protein